jgi:recombination protein RecA
MVDEFEDKLAKLVKKYDTPVGSLSDIALPAKFITTGNIAIDHIIGGGMPLGRLVELAGPPSSGKTTTALQTAAALQKVIIAGGDEELGIKADDKILYLDYEATIDQEYCKALGLDIDHNSFLLTQPDSLEDGANLAVGLIETGRIRLVIWDSVASMMPSAKAEAEIGKSLPAVQAKLMSDLGQKLVPLLYEHQTLNIFVNHLREVLDMSGRRPAHLGPKMSTPGGVALKFYESVRVEYKQLQQIKEKGLDHLSGEIIDIPAATNVEVKITKNKVAPPFKKAVVRVRFGRGFDNFWTAMQILLAGKEVMYSQGYYYFHKVEDKGLAPEWMERAKTGTQRPNIRTDERLFEAADDHPDWRDAVIAHASDFLKTNSVVMKAVTPQEQEDADALAAELDALVPPAEGDKRVGLSA